MATAFPPQEISVELNDNDPNSGIAENEHAEKSSTNPYLISTTTGGVENSCHTCMLAFGMVTFLIGVSTSSLAYATDSIDSVLFILGLSVLFIGIVSVTVSGIWRYYRKKRKEKMNEDLAELFYENKAKKFRL